MVEASPPRLILLCWLPGAGKTTLARRLAEDVPAIRLDADEWMARLGVDLHDEEARDRLERLFWQLAKTCSGSGRV
jgi:predicted kinase